MTDEVDINAIDQEEWSRLDVNRERNLLTAGDDAEVLLSEELPDKLSDPLESFLFELEERLIRGESRLRLQRWARKLGIEIKSYRRYEGIIRGTWKLEGTTMYVAETKRDELRQMYKQVYREAMENGEDPKHLAVALKTIDALAELDGLKLPEITVNVNQQNAPGAPTATKAELTNQIRERTMMLIDKMRERAEAHAAITSAKIEKNIHKMTPEEAQKLVENSDLVEIEEDVPHVMGVVK